MSIMSKVIKSMRVFMEKISQMAMGSAILVTGRRVSKAIGKTQSQKALEVILINKGSYSAPGSGMAQN